MIRISLFPSVGRRGVSFVACGLALTLAGMAIPSASGGSSDTWRAEPKKGATVSGTVKDAGGKLLADQPVRLTLPPEKTQSGRSIASGAAGLPLSASHALAADTAPGKLVAKTATDANGKYQFAGVAPGKYQVVAVKPGSGRAQKDVEVKDQPVTIDLQLEKK